MSGTKAGGKPGSRNRIERFLASRSTGDHVRYEDARAYLRKGLRWIEEEPDIRPCLDRSSIVRRSRRHNTRHDPNVGSTGFMRRFMDDLESLAGQHRLDVYVENVINEWLPEWLERRGYAQVGDDPTAPSFHLRTGGTGDKEGGTEQ